ncbi:MAG: DUF308 domain-containing protein [Ruminococcus sp.]|nr:DUF308 domain-containing protein [Ruminococcus sp.]
MFSRELDKLKRSVITTSIILMFAGLLLFLIPAEYIPVINIAAGFALLVICVVTMFIFLGSPKILIRYLQLCGGLCMGLAGIALWIFEDMFIRLLTLMIGILPALISIPSIFHAFASKRRSGRKGWWILVLCPIALMGFAVFVLWNPWFKNEHAVMHAAGAVLICTAIVNALRLIWLGPSHREQGGQL